MSEKIGEFTKDELLKYFAEAFNGARRYLVSPGTSDLEIEKWEPLFCEVEEKIFASIADNNIDTIQKLKDYFQGLSIIWANGAWRSSWSEALNYKQ